MTQYVHPEFGIFCPAPRLRRWLRVALACLALAAIGFAMLATGDRPDAESALAVATADESPAVESSPAASVTPRASVAGWSTFTGTQVGAEKTSCLGETWVYVDGKCVAAKPRKPRMVRVPVYRPAIASIPLGRNLAPIANVGEGGAVAGTARNRQGEASKPAQAAPADSATAAATEPAERHVTRTVGANSMGTAAGAKSRWTIGRAAATVLASATIRAAATARVLSVPTGEAAAPANAGAGLSLRTPSFPRGSCLRVEGGSFAEVPFYVRRRRYSALRNAHLRETHMPEIYVHAVKGRTLDQKRALVKDITDAVVKNFSVPVEAVTVEIVESEPTAKAKGGVLFSEMRR
jgi:4-oxalocrotonate tautomerase